MKSGTVPYPREFGPGAVGIDCRAVKRATASWAGGPHGASLKTNTFAKPAQDLLSRFKAAHGLLNDPIYTVQAHGALRPFFDEYGASLMTKETATLMAHRQRETMTSTLRWLIAHPRTLSYAEVRPIPEHSTPFDTSATIVTDCSGSLEVAAYWSQLPDPSRYAFNGQGNTGSLLSACVIEQSKVLPADFVVFRKGTWDTYGHHAAAILTVHPGHRDFDVFSFGYVGDPMAHLYSEVAANQAFYGASTATFLRWLPAP